MKKVVIIGGGIGGLASAGLLAQRGFDVTLYESRSQLGGRMGLLTAEGFRFDTGPSWYLMPEVYDHFFHLLGSNAEQELHLQRLKPAYRVFSKAAEGPITIVGNEAKDSATFEAREPGAAVKLKSYLDSAEKTYNLALQNFLYTDFRQITTFLKPSVLANGPVMLRRMFQSMDGYISSQFTDPVLKQILEYPAVFLGGSPFDTPALYHLMSYLDFRQGVFYPKDGLYGVTEAAVRLARSHGASLQTGHSVKRIIVAAGHATGVELADGTIVTADIVISNGDLEATQRQLLPEGSRDYDASYWAKRQPGPSALLMYLGVSGSLPQLEHHNLFFVDSWRDNFDQIYRGTEWPLSTSMYVSKPTKTDTRLAPEGQENLFVLVPLPANLDIVPSDLDVWADRYLDQIAEQADIPDLRQRITYRKLFGPSEFAAEFGSWHGSALGLSHTLAQSALFRPATKSRRVKNLYYVGANVQPGIGVPMCLISAEIITKDILGIKTSGPMDEVRP